MPLQFEWNADKARANAAKHGVSFDEATTAFDDRLSLTIADPEHSAREERFITLAAHTASGCWLSFIPSAAILSGSSVLGARIGESEEIMKKRPEPESEPEMRREYDFSRGVRGKHASRYAKGSNVVVLDPDVAKAFPNAEAVNDSLPALADIIRQQRKTAETKR